MKPAAVIALMLVLPGLVADEGRASNGDGSFGSVSLVPREVYIGDQAVLSFPSASLGRVLAPGERAELAPSELPEPTASATVLSVILTRGTEPEDEAIARIAFIPWNVGQVNLPPFSWKSVTVSPPAVTIASIVERTGTISLEPPRPPLLVPGTTWLLYALAFVSVVTGISLWLAIRKILALSSGNKDARLASRRIRFIRGELSRLERRIRKIDSQAWYAELSSAVRRYLALLGGASERRLDALTPSEAETFLRETFASAEIPRDGRLWLETFDRIRFSGEPAEDSRRDHIAALRDLAFEAERAERVGREGESHGRL